MNIVLHFGGCFNFFSGEWMNLVFGKYKMNIVVYFEKLETYVGIRNFIWVDSKALGLLAVDLYRAHVNESQPPEASSVLRWKVHFQSNYRRHYK